MARDIGGRAVDWFEQGRIRSFRVEVGRGCDPDSSGDGGCHFREQVTEEVGADDDVEGVWGEHEPGGQGVGVHQGRLDFRIVRGYLAEDLIEERHRNADTVRLGRPDQKATPGLRLLESVTDYPLHAASGKDALLDGDLIRCILVHPPAVFSLTTVISRSFGSASGLFTPRKSRAGRKFTYWSKVRLMGSRSPQRERWSGTVASRRRRGRSHRMWQGYRGRLQASSVRAPGSTDI